MEGHRIFSWEDETSMYDPKGYWSPGNDCYFATYKAYVPNTIPVGEESDYLDKLDPYYVTKLNTEEIKWLK